MKILISFLIGLVISTMAYAQTPYKVYCTLMGNEKDLKNNRVSLSIDYGQDSFKDNKLVDAAGKEIKFNTMVSAMNYMSKRGWNYEGCYNSKDQIWGGLIFVWIMSKEVTSDEQITEGFMTKRIFKELKSEAKKRQEAQSQESNDTATD